MVDEDKIVKDKEEPESEIRPDLSEEGEGKVEIEDILNKDDFDLEEVVSEEREMILEETKEKIDDEAEVIDELAEDKKTSSEEAEENFQPAAATSKKTKLKKIKKIKTEKKWLRIVATVIITALVTTAAVLGIGYYLNQRNQEEPTEIVNENREVIEETVTEEFTFINSRVGLNLREEPSVNAKSLITIPFTTKVPVLEENEGWIRTKYENQEGWISAEFTQKNDPLVYENETYGFRLSFKPSWAGYEINEVKESEGTAEVIYSVALPTTDKNWKEGSNIVPRGYATLFVMGIYTKAEWAKLDSTDGPKPAKLEESDKYVYTYLPGQNHPSDLRIQFNEINEIIKSFEVIKN